jgi:hypothetical protein
MTFESWTVWTFSIIHIKIYYTIFGGLYPKYNILGFNMCGGKCPNNMLFQVVIFYNWGTWWRNWLRHCATSWKVMGLIPNGVIGFF